MSLADSLGASRAFAKPGAKIPSPRFAPLLNARRWRPWVLPVAALLIWEAWAHREGVDPRFLPSLEAVAARAVQAVLHDDLLGQLLASLERNLIGFLIGGVLGVALGLALGFSAWVRRAFGPLFVTYRQISLFAWAPLVSLWFGCGETGKIAFIAMAAFQPTVINTWRGVAEIPHSYRELADVLMFGRLGFFRWIALPSALPQIFTGLHMALICAWSATIGAELLFNIAPGIGGQMNEGQQLFQMDRLFLCILILGVVGLALNLIAKAAERRLLRWRTG